jgi:hypothetical protein
MLSFKWWVDIRMRFRIRDIRFIFVFENIRNCIRIRVKCGKKKCYLNPIPCISDLFPSLAAGDDSLDLACSSSLTVAGVEILGDRARRGTSSPLGSLPFSPAPYAHDLTGKVIRGCVHTSGYDWQIGWAWVRKELAIWRKCSQIVMFIMGLSPYPLLLWRVR